eukprot:124307-Rhodomonas_salina.2
MLLSGRLAFLIDTVGARWSRVELEPRSRVRVNPMVTVGVKERDGTEVWNILRTCVPWLGLVDHIVVWGDAMQSSRMPCFIPWVWTRRSCTLPSLFCHGCQAGTDALCVCVCIWGLGFPDCAVPALALQPDLLRVPPL